MKGWNRFIHQFQKDVVQWVFFVLFLFLFRALFIMFFHHSIQAATGLSDVLRVVTLGLMYDFRVATFIILIPFAWSLAAGFADIEKAADRFRNAYGSAFVVLSVVAGIVNIGYFKEYHDQFNYLVFNVYYDDAKAIFATIWSEYHPFLNIFLISALSAALIKVKARYFNNGLVSRDRIIAFDPPLIARLLILVVIAVMLDAGLKGNFGRPLRYRNVGVTRDEFLNKTVANPYVSLARAFEEHARYSGRTGIESYIPDKDVRRAAQSVFSTGASFDSLDEYMKKTAAGPRNRPPRHVILLVMESYDSWPLMERYAALGLTENLKMIARNGVHFRNFLPAADFTMQSFTSIITGIPYTPGVEINYQQTSRAPYPSSLPETFRKLGYRTRFFYGGILSWQRIGDFAKAQGFEEVYGAPHVRDWSPRVDWSEWGVYDEYLFNFTADRINDERPSFNVVLTTTYHPPHEMDVWAKGFPLTKVPDRIAPMFNGTVSLKALGHLWYADQCIGRFVRETEKKLPGALFAFTGDHYSRRYINAKPGFYERSSVPFILYGKEVLKGISPPDGVAGGHIDIAPTLIELAAKRGFTYYSTGKNLLSHERHDLGIGWLKVIGPDYILDANAEKIYQLPGRQLPERRPDADGIITMFNNYYGIGWWRVKKGPAL